MESFILGGIYPPHKVVGFKDNGGMKRDMLHNELGTFLKARRAKLSPRQTKPSPN